MLKHYFISIFIVAISFMMLSCEDEDNNSSDSKNSLTVMTEEAAGENCTYGGIRLDSGIDVNANAKLDETEVSSTNYVCNGANGSNGVGCTVTESSNGTKTITCDEGTEVTVSDGADGSNGSDGESCTVIDNNNGTKTITCGEVSVSVSDGTDGTNGADGTNGTDGTNGENGNDGHNSIVVLETLTEDLDCLNGGTLVKVGVDINDSGILDDNEISVTQKVCYGLDGKDGSNSLVSMTDAGENCANGGKKIETGIDTNNNDLLDETEVVGTSYICNGVDGADGNNSLITISDAGANCANGGKTIEIGVDDNGNGILDVEEIDNSSYVCNGENGNDGKTALVNITDEAAGANCANGGKKVESGIDDDGNGVLDVAEVDSTNYVCNGADGSAGADGTDGSTALVSITNEAAGVNCANGGKKVESGIDDDGNGVLDVAEVDSTNYVCNGADGSAGADGTDGSTALVSITNEAAGVNCANGGKKVESGIDDDGNGVLDVAEVDSTNYVCNGADGSAGADGTDGSTALVSISIEPAGVNCTDGGQKVESGIDDDGNGVLDVAEVDSTNYVCNGADGSAGADGADGACANNNAPSIDSITIDGTLYSGVPVSVFAGTDFTVNIAVTDSDVTDTLSYNLSGGYANITNNNDGSFTLNFLKDGIFYFSIIVSDGCQVAVSTFAISAGFAVLYDGNGATSGSNPVDINPYGEGDSVTVLGKGTLSRTGYEFTGWNTASDGSGVAYTEGDVFTIPGNNITLYAQWTLAEGIFVFANPNIIRYSLDGISSETILNTGVTSIAGLYVDRINKKIYWENYSQGIIKRANFDGSNVESLVSGISSLQGIAVDGRTGGKIYWCNWTEKIIYSADLDGSNVTAIITDAATAKVSNTRYFDIDFTNNKLYWTDMGDTNHLYRADLDGTNIEDISTTTGSSPAGIAVDPAGGKIYWASYWGGGAGPGYFKYADLDGSNDSTFFTNSGTSTATFVNFDPINSQIYFSGNGQIIRADADGTNQVNLSIIYQNYFGLYTK